MIDRLHNQQGNNVLFADGTTLDPETLTITASNGMDLTPRIMWCESRGKYTTAFVKEHLPLENMVKYPIKSMTYNP
jgi:prepilin-type processing-associated H-X9-DG protein